MSLLCKSNRATVKLLYRILVAFTTNVRARLRRRHRWGWDGWLDYCCIDWLQFKEQSDRTRCRQEQGRGAGEEDKQRLDVRGRNLEAFPGLSGRPHRHKIRVP